MITRRLFVTVAAACAAFASVTPAVYAANTTCANADFIFLGERAQYGLSTAIYVKARLTAGRSYSVMAWAPFADAGEGGASVGVSIFTDNTCTAIAPGADSGDHEPLLATPNHTGDHDTIIPTTDSTVYIAVTNNLLTAVTAHVLVMETTLFSPWWFTGGTNQAYVEVRNNMVGATAAVVTLYRANGTICGTSSLNIAGNGNAIVEVNTVGSCAAALAGSAQVAFAGSPGGMVANITTINVPNGTSFDSPFAPRMVWSTFSR